MFFFRRFICFSTIHMFLFWHYIFFLHPIVFFDDPYVSSKILCNLMQWNSAVIARAEQIARRLHYFPRTPRRPQVSWSCMTMRKILHRRPQYVTLIIWSLYDTKAVDEATCCIVYFVIKTCIKLRAFAIHCTLYEVNRNKQSVGIIVLTMHATVHRFYKCVFLHYWVQHKLAFHIMSWVRSTMALIKSQHNNQ